MLLSNLVKILFLALISQTSAQIGSDATEDVALHLRHAETYLRFGMAAEGGLSAFQRGLSHADSASTLLQGMDAGSEGIHDLHTRLERLKSDLEIQQGLSSGTFYGRFPLVRLLTSSTIPERC